MRKSAKLAALVAKQQAIDLAVPLQLREASLSPNPTINNNNNNKIQAQHLVNCKMWQKVDQLRIPMLEALVAGQWLT